MPLNTPVEWPLFFLYTDSTREIKGEEIYRERKLQVCVVVSRQLTEVVMLPCNLVIVGTFWEF